MTLSIENEIALYQKEAETYAAYLSEEEQDPEIEFEVDEESFCRDFTNCIIVGGLPIVESSKHPKLLHVVTKIFSQIGPISDLQMPLLANNKTNGFAFVAYASPTHAQDAIQKLNAFALDKRHTLVVNAYSDLEKYDKLPSQHEELPDKAFVEPKNYQSWLFDPERRDMFVLRHGRETEIYYSDKGDITLDYDGSREKKNGKQWCSQYVAWSPQGTYLVTFHPQGIALWAGETYQKVARYAHDYVKRCVFSPNENYLATVSEADSARAIIIWNIHTNQSIRVFPARENKQISDEIVQGLMTPFKWSADDRFIARRGKDVISVHELPAMQLLQKKSLNADGVHDFFWSPTDPILAYWAPEKDNVPARVSLIELPSRNELRQKNLFNVSNCTLHWHPNGAYLAVKVTRHSKSKKTLYTNFELFRIREALVPVEMLEMQDQVLAFAWEPRNSRFAVVHGDSPTRASVSFYNMNGGARNNEITLLYTLADKQCTHLYWSPQGNNIVLAGLGEINGKLEFWDVDERQCITEQEHFKCTHVEWDPSGRVIMTAVCQPIENPYFKVQMDNGFILWSFQGKRILEEKKDAFYQFIWRPRPRSLLSEQAYANVVKNLKKYERGFNEADRLKERERKAREQAGKKKLLEDFNALIRMRDQALKTRRAEYIACLHGYDSEDENEYIVQKSKHDIVISQSEQVVAK